MATRHEMTAQPRSDEGKGASRRLRRAGMVPAIIYGGAEKPQSIQFEHEAVVLAARNEWFLSSILDLSIGGKKQKVLLRDLQKHPFKQQIMHMDFQRVSENEAVRVNVPLHFVNQEVSPAHKMAGVVVSHNLTEVEVSCLPKDLPEHIDVDLAELKQGDLVHLSDLVLPPGVEIALLKFGKEYDQTVVSAHAMREEVEETPEVPAEGAAAPEAGAPAADEGEKK
ncbi:MAG TPA: 50S ribosomal protein L25/general stress protein Ctc [Rhodanobacteraceae bacterium]|nr:50S ribosomal protein L25/general stress protein Ctc [Rhodanobacteraceae bacterium]